MNHMRLIHCGQFKDRQTYTRDWGSNGISDKVTVKNINIKQIDDIQNKENSEVEDVVDLTDHIPTLKTSPPPASCSSRLILTQHACHSLSSLSKPFMQQASLLQSYFSFQVGK